MCKVLIVDDEFWIRKRLISTIDWAAIGVREVYEAENGKQALCIAIENEPDIIITDINMPELSGIELMQALNESALFPRIILISGFNEFEYARSAIKLGAMDYLLKPVDENELIRIVKTCVESFENERKEKELLRVFEKSTGRIRKRFVADLFVGKVDKPDTALDLNNIGIDFPYASAVCVIAHLSMIANSDRTDYVSDMLKSFSVSDMMEEVLPLWFEHFFTLQIDSMNVVVLLSDKTGDELQQTINRALSQVQAKLQQEYHTDIIFSIGSEVPDIFSLHQSFKTAKYMVNHNNYNDWNSVLSYGGGSHSDHLDLQNAYSDYNINAITADIKNCDKAAAACKLDLLIDDFMAQTDRNPLPLQIKLLYINAMNTLFKNCLVAGPSSESHLSAFIDIIDKSDGVFGTDALKAGLARIIDFLVDQYQAFAGNKRHWLTDKIIEYIQANYAAPLSMNDVASFFYLNPSYFCKLFKEETGQTFTHFLMRLRINKAKELLSSSTDKLYDISASVGYVNVQYFSTIFKEMEGLTPSQYRSVYFGK